MKTTSTLVHHRLLLLSILCIASCTGITQPSVNYIEPEEVLSLPVTLNEASGIAHAGRNSCYVINDSGDKARIYQVSLKTGEVERKINLDDAKNHDWEELTEDKDFIYVGDFGNNLGNRKYLKIYKINKKDLEKHDEVRPDVIEYEYADRKKSKGAHNYDCEAMIVFGDSLYLFSKNRGDHGTDVYRLPCVAGKYDAVRCGHFDTKGLVTSAAIYEGRTNTLLLLGYDIRKGKYHAFLWIFKDISGSAFFSGTSERLELASDLQTESVMFNSGKEVFIGNESGNGIPAQISRIEIGKYLQ